MYKNTTIEKVEKVGERQFKVTMKQKNFKGELKTVEKEFNTILVAIGRDATTKEMNLSDIGVDLERNGKLKMGQGERAE